MSEGHTVKTGQQNGHSKPQETLGTEGRSDSRLAFRGKIEKFAKLGRDWHSAMTQG